MIEAASHLKLLLYTSLIVCMFAPFGMAPAAGGPAAWLAGVGAYFAKVALAAVILGIWEVSIAKMRVFRVSEFLGGAFVLAFIAILLAFLSIEVRR
jgi:formate hydrogenlyase subunit 4